MHFHLTHAHFWSTAIVLVSAYALWRGGSAERWVATANLAAWAVTKLVQDRLDFFDPQWGILFVDIAFLAVLVILALAKDRYWLLFAAAFQLLGVITHLAIVADANVRSLAYLRSLAIWSYLVLGTLALGTLLIDLRRRRALAF
jgi:hypothetical protein